ncbi:MAG: c-type cytochrome [Pseudooceanicola sp.]
MKSLAILTTILSTATAGMALSQEAGKIEYMNSCVACHGEDGRGQTGLAEILTVPVPDLTQISARNDGEFPMLDIIQIIDGRTGVRGHGYPMPVWGRRFEEAMGADAGYESELFVRGRVLALATYLQSIQE